MKLSPLNKQEREDETPSTTVATIAVTSHVPIASQDIYETRVGELHNLLKMHGDLLSADIVRHSLAQRIEYTIILRFGGAHARNRWQNNSEISQKLAETDRITGGAASISEAAGLGIWVDHKPGEAIPVAKYWKRVILSVCVVYPTLILLLAIAPVLFGWLPKSLQTLASVTVLSAALTWPLMPWASRISQPWLAAR